MEIHIDLERMERAGFDLAEVFKQINLAYHEGNEDGIISAESDDIANWSLD